MQAVYGVDEMIPGKERVDQAAKGGYEEEMLEKSSMADQALGAVVDGCSGGAAGAEECGGAGDVGGR